MTWDWGQLSGRSLNFALGVLLTSDPKEERLGEGVAGLDMVMGVMISPSSSSIALLLHTFRAVVLLSENSALSGCVWELVGLTSFSPERSDISDWALLPGLGLLPLPGLGLSRLVLLARVWYSCSGMLDWYFLLVLFFSMRLSSVSVPTLAPARPPLWEFLCSAMRAGCEGILGWGMRSLGCGFGGIVWILDVYPLFLRRCHMTRASAGGLDDARISADWTERVLLGPTNRVGLRL